MSKKSTAENHAVWKSVVLAAVAVVALAGVGGVIFFQMTRSDLSPPAHDRAGAGVAAPGVDAGITADLAPVPGEVKDFSSSNVVTLWLGQESDNEGLATLSRQSDGQTTVESLDGVTCRHLDRKPKGNGFLYFAIHPDFKSEELKLVRIEMEYLMKVSGLFRLQYDGTEGETHKPYRSVVAEGGEVAHLGGRIRFTRVQQINTWQTATFFITNGVFLNSQNGGADFRLEVMPPDIYVRRVSVAREAVPPSEPPVVP